MHLSVLSRRRNGGGKKLEEGGGAERSPSPSRRRRRRRGRRTVLGFGVIEVLFVWFTSCTIYLASKATNLPVLPRLFANDREIQPSFNVSSFHVHVDEQDVIDMRTTKVVVDNEDGGAWKQGWELSPKSGPLHIVVVPHTFSPDYKTAKSTLTTIVHALHQDDRRKFVWSDFMYLKQWWSEQSAEMQKMTRLVIKRGQLEFVTGVMDEANTHVYSLGLQVQQQVDFLSQTFGIVPKYGWSLHALGHTSTMAHVLQKFGYMGMVIHRVHHAVKKHLAQRRHLEFIWRQTWDASGDHDMLTHVMPFYAYDVPHTCGPDPAICCQFDFVRRSCPWGIKGVKISSDNVEERSLLLLDQYRKKASLYRTNTLLVPLGDDAYFSTPSNAETQYKNYQEIIDYIGNNVSGVTMQFGTLSDYFQGLDSVTFPLLKGSFVPYSDQVPNYYTGYYTSRVFDKALASKMERTLQTAESLGLGSELQEARMALCEFHQLGGMKGTEDVRTSRINAERLSEAIRDVQDEIMTKLGLPSSYEPCWRAESHNVCNDNETVAYNPLNTSQFCGDQKVVGHALEFIKLSCNLPPKTTELRFDPKTGLMATPIKEEWIEYKGGSGNAHVFSPGSLHAYEVDLTMELGGQVVSSPQWNRTVVVRPSHNESSQLVLDFIYEFDLTASNTEWLVRFSSPVNNSGVLHTDLNGFSMDTHVFRKDLPIQSQVFPMSTMASIEDTHVRFTVLSQHARAVASLQVGSMDVWLDRSAAGVQDNEPMRTRLRLVLEKGVFTNGEFEATPFCKLMSDELNHPLEMFGTVNATKRAALEAALETSHEGAAKRVASIKEQLRTSKRMMDPQELKEKLEAQVEKAKEEKKRRVKEGNFGSNSTAPIVPFVYMVYNRVDHLKIAIDSLLASDFDPKTVPLIISHDGAVPEAMSYVESIRSEFEHLIQIVHPHSCYEHPNTFPGNDESLNEGYKGDAYGNKRASKWTCCKHHFTWMLKTIFDMEFPGQSVDAFFVLEEDYLVSPTIYEAVTSGMRLYEELSKEHDLFGLTFERSSGKSAPAPGWTVQWFKTGPMVLTRATWDLFLAHATEYCVFDEYNWDWSLVHMMKMNLLPNRVLYPSVAQVQHFGGIFGTAGMHVDPNSPEAKNYRRIAARNSLLPTEFHETKYVGPSDMKVGKFRPDYKGYGGWGHPADHEHCLRVLKINATMEDP